MLSAYISLGTEVFFTNKLQVSSFLSKLVRQVKPQHVHLEESELERIRYYTVQSCITNNWFSSLTGHQMTRNEKQRALYLGALTPVLDSLTDDTGYTYAAMIEQFNNSHTSVPGNIPLARYLYKQLTSPANPIFDAYFNKVMQAQDVSLKQFQNDRLAFDELYAISVAKGGYSTLLYRSVIEQEFIAGEEDAIYLLGGILQLTNDMFDVYKDYKNKQQTLFTNTGDMKELKNLYWQKIQEMTGKFLALQYPFKNKRAALLKIMIILSRGIVCINQLIECQRKTDNVFSIQKYSREELICDMEKIGNIMKSINITNSLKKMIH
jgi:hypothetical protein